MLIKVIQRVRRAMKQGGGITKIMPQILVSKQDLEALINGCKLSTKYKRFEKSTPIFGKGSDITKNLNIYLDPNKCYEIAIIEIKE